MELSGRTVLLTGATGGLGHAIARALAARGAQVVVTGRRAEVLESLTDEERSMVGHGLLVGIVTDGGKPEYERGDFLVRGLIGVDPDKETIAVGALVRPGQVIRLHARDADSADADLREALDLHARALGGSAAGALVFTCNGRGRAMFDHPDHDAEVLDAVLSGAPAAGFFEAGEIGPAGGAGFLHGFTATVPTFGA